MTNHVTVKELAEKWKLKNLTPGVDIGGIQIHHAEVNRPALQMAGFFNHFDKERIQMVGNVEYMYTKQLPDEIKNERFRELFSYHFPCLIICRNHAPHEQALKYAQEAGVPVLQSERATTELMAEIITWLRTELAPSIRIHGVLVSVGGIGVLITGESGIGKSETALELIKRGHRLVADDAVDIRKVSEDTLVGSSPEMIKHFIELRGIGIIDVKHLYGIGSVQDSARIEMVIHLEEWVKGKMYDRMGLEEKTTEYLGNRVACYELPVRPGRNLAMIVEAAAMNHRQKVAGYNAAQTLYDRYTAMQQED